MKKGQVIVISALVVIVIMILVISLFISQYERLFGKEDKLKDLQKEADNTGSVLLGEPYPEEWNSTNVLRVGLLENGVVSSSSLIKYGNITYSRSKILLGIKGDYLFFFTQENNTPIKVENREYWGWNGIEEYNGGSRLEEAVALISNSSKYIAKDEKFIELNIGGEEKRVKIVTYVWDFARGETSLDPLEFQLIYDFTATLFTVKDTYKRGEVVNLTGVA